MPPSLLALSLRLPISRSEKTLLRVTTPRGMAVAIPRFSGCVFLPKDRGITPPFRPQIARDTAPNLLRDVTPLPVVG